MLTARLKAPPQRHDKIVESKFYSFTDSALWDAKGLEVANYSAGLWRCEQGAFISIDFEAPVLVKFSNPELRACEQIGPFPLRVIGATMCRTGEAQEVVAEFDDTQTAWRLSGNESGPMQRFTIMPASSPI